MIIIKSIFILILIGKCDLDAHLKLYINMTLEKCVLADFNVNSDLCYCSPW